MCRYGTRSVPTTKRGTSCRRAWLRTQRPSLVAWAPFVRVVPPQKKRTGDLILRPGSNLNRANSDEDFNPKYHSTSRIRTGVVAIERHPLL